MLILLSYILFVCYLSRSSRRKRKRKTTVVIQPRQPTQAQIQAEKRRAEKLQALAEKQAAQREQAESDIGHWAEVAALLEEELNDARRQLDKAREKVNQDKIFELANNQKTMEKHQRELTKARRNVISIDNRLHMAQSKLNKAERILNQPED